MKNFSFYIAKNGLFSNLPLPSTHSADEVILWRYVLDRAVRDVGIKSMRKEALAWFSLENEDFIYVCAYAMLDPKEVYKAFHDKIKGLILRDK